jgi:hypothetical protein
MPRGQGIDDLTGQKFNRLTVIAYAPHAHNVYGSGRWVCQCECGNTVTVLAQSLRSGHTKSCGCIKPPGRPIE